MSQITLNPFDIDLVAMIETLFKMPAQPVIDVTTGIVTIYMDLRPGGIPLSELHAIENAVKGRAGDQFIDFAISRSNVVIQFKRNEENVGSEERYSFTKPVLQFGTRYARKLKEVDAVQFTRENQDDVIRFTGGGNVTIPRTMDGIAVYEFPTENGMLLTVYEGEMIINDNGRFYKKNRKEFLIDFEEK